MFWLIPVFGLVIGVLIGSIITIEIPLTMAKYLSVAVLAALLAFLGDQLSVDLYMAAVFVFGIRIFNNLATIRHHILNRFMQKHNMHASQHKNEMQ